MGERGGRDRFAVLDGWRGICALLVALFHFRALDHFYLWPFFRNSYLFVDFFFVLSGFVITHAYGGRIVHGEDAMAFMLRRFGRLWPLHAAVLAMLVCNELVKAALVSWSGTLTPSMPPFAGPTSVASLVTNLLLSHSFGLQDSLTWNGPSWSISAEFYAYVVFAVTSLLAGRRFLAVGCGLAAFGALVVATRSPFYMDATYDYGLFRCLYGFFVGHFVYRLYRRTAVSAEPPFPAPSVFEALSLILAATFVSLAGRGPLSMAAPLTFAGVVYVFSFEAGVFSKLLSTASSRALGRWSYSVYMVHVIVILAIDRVAFVVSKILSVSPWIDGSIDGEAVKLLTFGGEGAMDVAAVVYLALVAAAAALTYRYIEQPGREFFAWLAVRTGQRGTGARQHVAARLSAHMRWRPLWTRWHIFRARSSAAGRGR